MEYYSSGKFLLTSEYMVLRGAKALSLSTLYGQSLTVSQNNSTDISWESIDKNGNIWFSAVFSEKQLEIIKTSDNGIALRLQKLLQYIQENAIGDVLKPGTTFQTSLQFNREWGLGSSSTLVSNLAKFSGVNPIKLLHSAFKGSGYDVATGFENHSIVYSLKQNEAQWEKVDFDLPFTDQLFFVYLNQKQLSEKEVMKFDQTEISSEDIAYFSDLTDKIMRAANVEVFSECINLHEQKLSYILQRPTVKQSLFSDYNKSIKSLGAWGGDFILVVGTKSDQVYFANKGYQTIIDYTSLIDSK